MTDYKPDTIGVNTITGEEWGMWNGPGVSDEFWQEVLASAKKCDDEGRGRSWGWSVWAKNHMWSPEQRNEFLKKFGSTF